MESTRQNYQCRAINIDIVDLNGFKRLGGVHGKCLSLVNFYDARVHVIVIVILIVIVLNFNDAMYQEIEIILIWSKILKCIVIIDWNTYIVVIQLCIWIANAVIHHFVFKSLNVIVILVLIVIIIRSPKFQQNKFVLRVKICFQNLLWVLTLGTLGNLGT